MKRPLNQLSNKQYFWIIIFLLFILLITVIGFFVNLWIVNTPTDWSITIMMDNNTKEVFYLINESGGFK